MQEKNRIRLFALSTCAHCRELKEMLDIGTFAFDCIDVDLLFGKQRREILEEMKKFNKRCTFPTMVIGDIVIVGFKEKEIKEVLGIDGC